MTFSFSSFGASFSLDCLIDLSLGWVVRRLRRKEKEKKSREKKGFVKININLIEGLNFKWLKV